MKEKYQSLNSQKELGFGTKIANQGDRFINRDGSFNVEKRGVPLLKRFSIYHSMINMAWWKFIFVILCTYICINVFFAGVYLLIGFEHLQGTLAVTPMEQFSEAFFFSAQTFTTVGYGRINPVGVAANAVVVLELLLGLLSLALATGFFYGRFSRPVGKIIFSEQALVSPYQGITGLMLRIANAKDNQLTDVEVQLTMSRIEGKYGTPARKFYQLELERDRINFLALSWTIVHPITESSPIYGCTAQELEESDIEFMVTVKGFDDIYAQAIQARTSYKYHEVVLGARFVSTYHRAENGKTVINLATLGSYEPVDVSVEVEKS